MRTPIKAGRLPGVREAPGRLVCAWIVPIQGKGEGGSPAAGAPAGGTATGSANSGGGAMGGAATGGASNSDAAPFETGGAASDTPETVYVQTYGATTGPSWLSISSGGEPFTAFPACLPECGSDKELDVCHSTPGMTEAVVIGRYEGSVFTAWDGYFYELRWGEGCQVKTAAPDGPIRWRCASATT